ncbi:MAG: hypothetical protein WD316_08970 [Phycisphaeraceae bacterium]
MLRNNPSCLIVMLVLVAGLWGCARPIGVHSVTRRAVQDIQEDQPWLGPEQQAQAFISAGYYLGLGPYDWLEWVDAEGETVAEGHKVVKQCRRYLERQGLWEDLRGERIRIFEGTDVPRIC